MTARTSTSSGLLASVVEVPIDAGGASSLEKDPEEWVSGDEPMTESQKSYLDTLAKQAGEKLTPALRAELQQALPR